MAAFPKFFEGNEFFIDEKVNFLKFENVYRVYNEKGEHIGMIKQKLTGGQKILRLLINKKMLPFRFEIRDAKDELQVTLSRGWTFWMSKITVAAPDGMVMGFIQQKFKLFKPNFHITDPQGNLIAEITGDWTAWNFSIKSSDGAEIGRIDKKWAGAMKEIFTSADKYNVSINPEYPEETNKIAIISAAVTIDMVLKEQK